MYVRQKQIRIDKVCIPSPHCFPLCTLRTLSLRYSPGWTGKGRGRAHDRTTWCTPLVYSAPLTRETAIYVLQAGWGSSRGTIYRHVNKSCFADVWSKTNRGRIMVRVTPCDDHHQQQFSWMLLLRVWRLKSSHAEPEVKPWSYQLVWKGFSGSLSTRRSVLMQSLSRYLLAWISLVTAGERFVSEPHQHVVYPAIAAPVLALRLS